MAEFSRQFDVPIIHTPDMCEIVVAPAGAEDILLQVGSVACSIQYVRDGAMQFEGGVSVSERTARGLTMLFIASHLRANTKFSEDTGRLGEVWMMCPDREKLDAVAPSLGGIDFDEAVAYHKEVSHERALMKDGIDRRIQAMLARRREQEAVTAAETEARIRARQLRQLYDGDQPLPLQIHPQPAGEERRSASD
jgi:hypothetical protein